MPDRPAPSRTARTAPALLFWAAACLLLFWALGDRGLWGPEGRWGEITRAMILNRDLFHPAINGNPYFDKPLLTYWLVALASLFTGGLNEWAVRLPSAVAALLGLWATVSMGRRLWSEEVGRTAGWLLLTCYGVLYWGRTGTADMENLAAVALALAWYWLRRNKLDFVTCLVFYLLCFLGAQTKGLGAVVVPVLAVLPDMFRERRLAFLFRPAHLTALLLGLAVYLLPLVYAEVTREGYSESGLILVFRENILRYVRPFDHVKPFYVYLYYLPAFFLPWAPLFLISIAGTVALRKKPDPSTRWLLQALLLVFLFFTLSGSRRSYYILPLLPLSALLTARFFAEGGAARRWRGAGLGLQAGLLAVPILLEIASPVLWPLIEKRTGFVPPPGLAPRTVILGLAGLLPYLLARTAPSLLPRLTGMHRALAPLVVSGAVILGGFFVSQQGLLEAYRTESRFVKELGRRVAGPPRIPVAFYQVVSPKVLFALNDPEPVKVLANPGEVRDYLTAGRGPRVLVSRNELVQEWLPALPPGTDRNPWFRDRILPWEQEGSGKWRGKLSAWKFGTDDD